MRGLTYWKLLAIKDLIYLSIKCIEIPSYQGCVRKGFSINTVALRCQCFPPHFRVFYLFQIFLPRFLSVSFLVFCKTFSSYFFQCFLPCFLRVFFLFFLQKDSLLFFYKKFPSYFYQCFHPRVLRIFFLFFCRKFPFYFSTKSFLPIFISVSILLF